MLRNDRAGYSHSGDAINDAEQEVVQVENAPGAKPSTWNGKTMIPIDEWVQTQLERAPDPGPMQRRTLAAILGLYPED